MSKSKRKSKTRPPAPRLAKPADKDQALAELMAAFADVTDRRQRAFLAGYVIGRGITAAQRVSGVHWRSHYRWLEDDSLYRERFELVKMFLADAAEEEAYRRAFVGYEITGRRGNISSSYKSYSDALAIFLLKGIKPNTYGRYAPDPDSGGPSAIEITIMKEGEETEQAPALPEISIPCSEPEEKS